MSILARSSPGPEARYRGGVDSFLANLDAQRSLYAARAQETATMLTALENRVTLYRVLAADPAAASPRAGRHRCPALQKMPPFRSFPGAQDSAVW